VVSLILPVGSVWLSRILRFVKDGAQSDDLKTVCLSPQRYLVARMMSMTDYANVHGSIPVLI
jgi:hypothetical protein